MTPDRNAPAFGNPDLPDPAPTEHRQEAAELGLPGASAEPTPVSLAASGVDEGFLNDFFGDDGFQPAGEGLEGFPAAAFEAGEPELGVEPENGDLEIRALRAGRSLQQVFPLNSPTEALALAAMPHYDLGGQAAIRMGRLEMRFLLAEAEATLKGASQHVVEGTKLAIRENGDAVELPTRTNSDIRSDGDATIQSLLDGGYIREVSLSRDEQESVSRINDVLREDLPKDWKVLDSHFDKRLAFELTDAGIEAGRSVRNWGGNTPDAGMVRLPDGVPMPSVVATDTYDLSAVIMENRSLAGTLQPGELGAFLRAELASIEYSYHEGADPQVTAGRLDGVIAFAKVAALGQIQNGTRAEQSPLTPADMSLIAQRGRHLLLRLPEVVPEVVEAGDGVETRGLDKWGSMADIAHLEGVRIACEAISFRLDKAGIDMTDPREWAGFGQGLDGRAPTDEQQDTMAMADAIKVVKNWMKMVAAQGENIRSECRAFAQGAFGARGAAIADHLLARA